MVNYFQEAEKIPLLGGLPEEAKREPIVEPDAAARQAQIAILGTTPADELVQAFEDRTERLKVTIAEQGDEEVRTQAATQQQDREFESIARLRAGPILTPEDQAAVAASGDLAIRTFQEDVVQRRERALEQEAVKKIQNLAASDPVQAKLLLNNLELGDADHRIRDIMSKRLILQREIERAKLDTKTMPWYNHAFDFLLSALPLNSSISNNGLVPIDKGLKNWYDTLFSGERVRNESNSLYNMDIDAFSAFVRDELIPGVVEHSTLLGYTNNTEKLNLLTHLQTAPSALETNAWNTLDNIGLIPISKFGKIPGIIGTVAKVGGRKEAASILSNAVKDLTERGVSRAGVTAVEATDNLAPTIMRTGDAATSVTVSSDAVTLMERAKYVLSNLIPTTMQERFVGNELERAIETHVARAERQFGDRIKDVSPVQVESLADGSNVKSIELTLGKDNLGGYGTKKQVLGYARSIGERGEVIRDESGQWFLKVKVPIVETGFYTNLLNVKTTTEVSRRILSSRLIEDSMLADYAQFAGNKRAKALKELGHSYAQTVNKLGSSERYQLAQVAQTGSNSTKWFTRDEFTELYQKAFKRSPAEKEWAAYTAMIEYNDLEFTLRNADLYKTKYIKGYRTVSFSDGQGGSIPRMNGIVDAELKELPKSRFYVVSGGVHYTNANPINPARWEQLKASGHRIVTLEQPYRLADGTEVKDFVVKGEDLDIEMLRPDQIAYREGGHRMYSEKYFAKQTSWGTQPDTGVKFLRNPNVYMVGTKAEVTAWTIRMNSARTAALNGADANAIDEIFQGSAGHPTGEEFLKDFDHGEEFEVIFDREMPSAYVKNPAAAEFVDFEEGGFNGFMRTNGRMYYSAKGTQLKDWRGELAPTLNPYETINRSLMNIANITSFSDYKIVSVERWANTFSDYINKGSVPTGSSDMFTFLNATMKSDTPAIIKTAAEAQRDIIRRNLGWKSAVDRKFEQESRRFAEWVAGDTPGAWNTIADRTINWVGENNPLMALRGLAFDMKLGMFNPLQFPLQIQTSIAATTLSPKMGMKGLASYPFVRSYLRRAGGEHDLDFFVKNGQMKLMGFTDPAEFKDYMRSLKNSGFMDIGGTHQSINDYGTIAAASEMGDKVRQVREAGRFFFNEGEMMNRAVAYRIAWDEVTVRGLTDKAEFIRTVAGRAEDYAFSMSRESNAYWQRGILSIPTQFFSYQVRMLEAMLSNKFTRAQRARLLVGQGLLYGSAGVPGFSMIQEHFNNQTGTTPQLTTLAGVLSRGQYDFILSSMLQDDVVIGKRYGTGDFLPTLFEDIFGMGQYGEKSPIEFLGGATVNITWETAKTLPDFFQVVARYGQAESGGDIGRPISNDAVRRLLSNVSTLSNGYKMMSILQYGRLESNKGTILATDVPPQTGWALALLGAQPSETERISAMMNFKKNRDKHVDEAAKVVTNYRTKMLTEPDRAAEYGEEVNLFIRTLPPEIRQDVLRRAHKQVDKSLYEGLAKRTKEIRQRDERIRTWQR